MRAFPDNAIGIIRSFQSDLTGIFNEKEARSDGLKFQHYLYPLTVICSVAKELDGKLWLHVSFAHPKRIPDYDEIQKIKKHFIGENKYAIMVFPEKDKHVNIHPYCLHLWHCVDGHPLPEFSGIVNGSRSL